MHRNRMFLFDVIILLAGCLALAAALGATALAAPPGETERRSEIPKEQSRTSTDAGLSGFDAPALREARRQAGVLVRQAAVWYRRTPPGERMCWGGITACALLAMVVILERLVRLRRRSIIPDEFTPRFLDRLHEGKLDGGKALDYCEMNPSPAARIALAAVRRWGRPAGDLERAVTLSHRVEAERLRRNVGTLRRVAALTPLLGLLGTLLATQRVLAAIPSSGPLSETAAATAWGPGLAAALVPLTVGVALATLALAAYDILTVRIERLAGALDHLGGETIDAIAMAAPPPVRALPTAASGTRELGRHPGHSPGTRGAVPSPHQERTAGRRTGEGGRQRLSSDHDLGF